MKTKIIQIFSFILITSSAFSDGGSNYSIFGIGDLNYTTGGLYNGLGGTSIAMPSKTSINLTNPAMLTELENTRIQIGYNFNQNYVKGTEGSVYQNNGQMNHFLGSLAIDTSIGLNLAFGFNQITNINYFVSTPIYSALPNPPIDTLYVSGKNWHKGTGGISNAFLAFSIKPMNKLAFGLTLNTLFGKSQNSVQGIYDDSYSWGSYTFTSNSYSGFGYRFGLAFEPIDNLKIGSFIYQQVGFNVNSNIHYSSLTLLQTDTVFSTNISYKLNPLIGVGASYLSDKFIFAFDYLSQDFTNLEYNVSNNVVYSKYNAYSFGIQRIGNPIRSSGLADRITYNFGLSFKNLYYLTKNQQVSEYSVALGMGIPMSNVGNFDISLNLGKRGTPDNNQISEIFARFVMNISIGDNSWFHPFKKNY